MAGGTLSVMPEGIRETVLRGWTEAAGGGWWAAVTPDALLPTVEVLLLTGASGVEKSTVAYELARLLQRH